MNDPVTIIKDLHASEIHGSVSWFYDSCWTAGLGSDVGGWDVEKTFGSFEEAVEWLRDEAIRRYPDSEFAKRYGSGFV